MNNPHVKRFLQDAIDFECNPNVPYEQLVWKASDAVQCHIEGLLSDDEYNRVQLQLSIAAQIMKKGRKGRNT